MTMGNDLLNRATFEQAVAAGIRAPSMYNAQPWRFRRADGAIEAYIDPAQRPPVADPNGWAARIALGAAVANVRLALCAAGLASEVSIRAADDSVRVVVRPTARQAAAPVDLALCDAIGSRRSHRRPFSPALVPNNARAHLADAAQHSRCWLELVDDREEVSRVAEIVRLADNQLRRDDAYTAELREWTGRDEDEAMGISTSAAGVTPEGQDVLAMRDYGGAERAPGRDFEAEPLLAVLGTVGDTPYDDIVAGMALQIVLLTATSDGLATSMLSQPMEIPSARDLLGQAVRHYGTPQMLIRVGYGSPGTPTPRRSIDEVIDE